MKTASTSVEAYFEPFCLPEGAAPKGRRAKAYESNAGASVSKAGIVGSRGPGGTRGVEWYHHMPAKQIRKQLDEEIWNSYLKFCVVRNPFDKAVSAFYHFKKYRESVGADTGHVRFKTRIFNLLHKKVEFESIAEEFELWLRSGAMMLDRDKYVIKGQYCMDDVIRYEELLEGMDRICRRLGERFDPADLKEFKRGFRDNQVKLEEIYTPKSVQIVANLYAYEIKRFEYKAPAL